MAATIKVRELSRNFQKYTRFATFSIHKRLQSTLALQQEGNGSPSSLYPPVKGKYPPGKWGNFTPQAAWYLYERGNKYDRIFNVRERLESMAEEEHTYSRVTSYSTFPDTLLYKKYITKTNAVDGCPDIIQQLDVDRECASVKSDVLDTILLQYDYYNYYRENTSNTETKDWQFTKRFLGSLVNCITTNLAAHHFHLLCGQFDRCVSINTFWTRTGYGSKDTPAMGKWLDHLLTFQYDDNALHQIRVENPLPMFLPEDSELNEAPSVECSYAPKVFSQKKIWGRSKSVAGYWIGDPCEFTQVSFHTMDRNYLWFVEKYGEDMARKSLYESAMTSGFASCVAQAHNQGFHMFHDVTYPFTTQTVSYGGGEFYFCAYQLNTLHLWKTDEANQKSNVAFVSGPHRLYETVEDGKVIGFNDNTLEMLVKCFALSPVDRGVNLRPNAPGRSPVKTELYINHKGTPSIEKPKTGRWEFPKEPIYPVL